MFPFALGVDDNFQALQNTVDRLNGNYGVYTCEYNEDRTEGTFQWDYPIMWPPMIYFLIEAFLKLNKREESCEVACAYIDLCADVFKKTGNIWEKYNVKDKSVAISNEYKTPPMLGWTAGVYVYCKGLLSNS